MSELWAGTDAGKALDLASGKLYYRIRPRKRWREFLGLLKALRARRPGEKLYLVLDNLSPHKHAKVRAWAADNDPAGLSADPWLLAELERGRVRGLALLRAQRHRPPQP
ncbi:hypothetical protein [Streptomyces avermitilis]|uniref:hypothetical protein n=1 Tax=Streptomyces avermitilis TaxID=33903 RepID=UPI0038163A83